MKTGVDRLGEAVAARAPTHVGLSALLAGILVGLVPVGAVVFGAPVRLLLVGGAVVYVLASVALDAVFEGAAVAFVFTAVFNTRAMFFVDGPELRLVSLLGLLTAALLVHRGVPEGWLRRPGRRLVVGAAAVFVLWGALAALLGSGPDREAAIWYVVEQARYLALLVLAALLVDRGDPEDVLAPVTAGLGATLVFAVDEVFAGKGGYLVNFGTVGYDVARLWPSPSLSAFTRRGTVLYEAGAFGQNRTIVGLAIVFVPIVLAFSLRSRRHALVSLTGTLVPTIDMRIDYLAPATTDLRTEAEVVRSGGSVSVVDAEVYDTDGRHIASARGTYKTDGERGESLWSRGVDDSDVKQLIGDD